MNSPSPPWVYVMEWEGATGFAFKIIAGAATPQAARRACEAGSFAYGWSKSTPVKRKSFPCIRQTHARWRARTGR